MSKIVSLAPLAPAAATLWRGGNLKLTSKNKHIFNQFLLFPTASKLLDPFVWIWSQYTPTFI